MDPEYKKRDFMIRDYQYADHLRAILENGQYTEHPNQKGVRRKVLLTLPPFVYKLDNGFPVITERKMPFAKTLTPISEMIAFIHGARTGEEMEKWGVKWWRTWTTPEKCAIFGLAPGDMGDGSYGAAFNAPKFEWEENENHPDGGRWTPKPFRQFEHLIKEIKERPFLSTHKVTTWLPQYCLQHSELQRKVVVAPCHGDVQVTILGDELSLTMNQRSGDYPVGVPADIMMYGALTIMLAHVTGFKPHMLVHRVIDAHIYENQESNVIDMLGRKPMLFPTLHLTEEGQKVTDIYDFRPYHFELRDYESHPAIPGIPVTE